MSAEQLVEESRKLMLDEVKSNINAALLAIRTDRNDPIVTTEPPRKYFIYEGAHTFECPAVFVFVRDGDFPEDRFGPNHINAILHVIVSAVVEDQDATALTIKSERYQAALFRILHRKHLEDVNKNIKIYCRVTRVEFSPVLAKEGRPDAGVFRKEVSLEVQVNHWESPT